MAARTHNLRRAQDSSEDPGFGPIATFPTSNMAQHGTDLFTPRLGVGAIWQPSEALLTEKEARAQQELAAYQGASSITSACKIGSLVPQIKQENFKQRGAAYMLSTQIREHCKASPCWGCCSRVCSCCSGLTAGLVLLTCVLLLGCALVVMDEWELLQTAAPAAAPVGEEGDAWNSVALPGGEEMLFAGTVADLDEITVYPQERERYAVVVERQSKELMTAMGVRPRNFDMAVERIGILFLGDAFEAWSGKDRGMECLKCVQVRDSFNEMYLNHVKGGALAMGIKHDRVANLLWALHSHIAALDTIRSGLADPRILVLHIGKQDIIEGTPPKTIAAGVREMVQWIKLKLPSTKLVLTGVLPFADPGPERQRLKRWYPSRSGKLLANHIEDKHTASFSHSSFYRPVAQVNAWLKLIADDDQAQRKFMKSRSAVYYLDCGGRFLVPNPNASEDMRIPFTLMKDGEHLTAEGHRKFQGCLAGFLEHLLADS